MTSESTYYDAWRKHWLSHPEQTVIANECNGNIEYGWYREDKSETHNFVPVTICRGWVVCIFLQWFKQIFNKQNKRKWRNQYVRYETSERSLWRSCCWITKPRSRTSSSRRITWFRRKTSWINFKNGAIKTIS